LRLAARREERSWVRLEQADPRGNVARAAEIAVNRELGAQECRAQFGDQFLRHIGALAEARA
jgi:hypothetical protein